MDGFISYSHQADGELAPLLRTGLERFAKPWNRRRLMSIFLDETGLSANPGLWTSITDALEDAGWLIVLCSPDAARSEWVNREIGWWAEHKGPDRILPVLTSGELQWDASTNAFDSASSAAPDALRGLFLEEPRFVDLRWAAAQGDNLDTADPRFQDALAELAGPMRGVSKSELVGEDLAQHRRTRRLARGAVALLSSLLVVSLVAGGLAIAQRSRAEREADRARREARHAVATALAATSEARSTSHLDLAALMAVEAFRREDTFETRRALLGVATVNEHPVTFRPTFRERLVAGAISADATAAAGVTEDGDLMFEDLTARKVSAVVRSRAGSRLESVALSNDGRLLAGGSRDGSVVVWDAVRHQRSRIHFAGHPPGAMTFTPASHVLAFSPDRRTLVSVSYAEGAVRFWSVATGKAVAPPLLVDRPTEVVYGRDGRSLAVASFEGTVLIDTATYARRGVLETGLTNAVAVSPDGTRLAAGQGDGVISVWDMTSSSRIASANVEGSTVALAFAPDNLRFASVGTDLVVRLRTVATARQVGAPLRGHLNIPALLLFASDDELLSASGTEMATWELTGTPLARTVEGLEKGVLLAVRGSFVATLDGEDSILVHDSGKGRRVGRRLRLPGLVKAAMWVKNRSDQLLVSLEVSGGGRPMYGVAIANLDTGRVRWPRPVEPTPITGIDGSADGRLILLGTSKSVREISAATGRQSGSTISVTGASTLSQLDYSPRRQEFVVVDTTARIRRFSSTTHRLLASRQGGPLATNAFHDRTGDLVALIDGASVDLLDPATLRSTGTTMNENDLIDDIAFSSDDRVAAMTTGSWVSLWDVRSRRLVGRFAAPGRTFSLGLVSGTHPAVVTTPTSQDGVGRVVAYDLDPQNWVKAACRIAGRNLTRNEWRQALGDEPYRSTCPR